MKTCVWSSAWTPIGKGRALLEEAPIVALAEKHGRSPAQVVLRWHVQLGVLPIPKSATPARQIENLDIEGFALSDAEMASINALTRADGRLFDGDPRTHEEF